MWRNARRIHFVGIGGIGMSGIAQLLLQRGLQVSGSDLTATPIIARLQALGAVIHRGHDAAHLTGVDAVVYSSSIAPQNPELAAARNRAIPIYTRAQMLEACLREQAGIAVSGSHGKTTTTALIASVLIEAGLDPTVLVGAEVDRFGGNARLGTGRYAVVEADESDGSFVYLAPTIAVVTNVEEEHLDYYRNWREILQAYQQFIERVPPGGALLAGGDDPGVRRLLGGRRRPAVTYGLDQSCDIVADHLEAAGRHATCQVRVRGRRWGRVTLQVPGVHNLVNSLAAVGVGLQLGLEATAIRRALAGYEGASRRFEHRGDVDGILVVEDYAHHPTEIAATLQAARTWPGRRIFCVFQPHRFSRTKYLAGRFGACFAGADEVILTDVYAASEEPMDGVGSEILSSAVRSQGYQAISVMPRRAIVPYLLGTVRSGDLVLVLGAGDIGQIAGELVQALTTKSRVLAC